MMPSYPHRLNKPALAAFLSVLILATITTAGSLTPSASPASTFHTLTEIYDSIASTSFDSSSITANQNGSLLANLKYINSQLVWASASGDAYYLGTGNIGIGTTTPLAKLEIAGDGTIDMLKLSESDSLKSYGMVVRDGDFFIRAPSSSATFSPRWNTLSIASNSLATIIGAPASPSITGTYNTSGNARDVTVSGKYAYVADDTAGLQIIDISVPSAPVLVSTYSTGGLAWRVRVSGKYAYVTTNTTGIYIIDISNPFAPTLVSVFDTTSARGLYISGRYAYIADMASGLQILDISNPFAPTLTGTLDTSGNAYDVYVFGKYAYVADDSSGLQIIDISNPAVPTLTGTYDTSGNAEGVYVSGKYAYVADLASGLQIINISNPAAPSLVSTYDTSGTAWKVEVSGRYAYVADYASGLHIFDIGGVETHALYAGNISTSNLAITENLDIGNSLYVRNGGNFGPGGLMVQGFSAFSSASWFGSHASISGNFELTGTVSSHLTPTITDTYDLGSTTVRWRDLYLASGSLHIGISGDEAIIDYNVTNDYLAFKPDGSTTKFIITDQGNVGIGTISPTASVQIGGAFGSGGNLRIQTDSSTAITLVNNGAGTSATFGAYVGNTVYFQNSGGLIADKVVGPGGGTGVTFSGTNTLLNNDGTGNVGIGTTNPTSVLHIVGNTSTLLNVASGSNSRFVVLESGNVGIGTTVPTQKLHVNGSLALQRTDGSPGGYISYTIGENFSFFNAAGSAVPVMASVFGSPNGGSGVGMTMFSNRMTFGVNNSVVEVQANGLAVGTGYMGQTVPTNGLVVEGFVGIGTITPTTTLDVSGNASISGNFELTGTASVGGNVFFTGIASTGAGYNYVCRNPSTGAITHASTCTPSALRFKENVQNLSHGLDWVSQLRPTTFDWKHDGNPSLGFIAEEVASVSSLLTLYQDEEIFSVNYPIITAVLTKAIQELASKQYRLEEVLAGKVTETDDDSSLVGRILEFIRDTVVRVRELVARKITTDVLCLDDVCVTKEEFRQLLEQAGVAPAPPSEPTPTPTPTLEPSATLESTPEPTETPTPPVSPEPTETPTPTETPPPTPTPTPSVTPILEPTPDEPPSAES